MFKRYNAQIAMFTAIYHHARRALVALDPVGEINLWISRFHELKDSDVHGPGREPEEPSDGKSIPSWIWLIQKPPQGCNKPTPDTNSNNTPNNKPDPGPSISINVSKEVDLIGCAANGDEIALSIRSHWARCQAHAERYKEEAELTVEEMRRMLEFFKWKSCWWLSLRELWLKSSAPPLRV
jgi:hypothetical protein